MSLWDIAVCINRDDRWHRQEHARREFEKAGVDVGFFSATKWEDLHPDSAKRLTKRVPQHHNLLGHVACGLSHHAAMTWAVNSGYNSLCIFEDDVELTDHFAEKIAMVESQLVHQDPSWQFLYLGYRNWKGHTPERLNVNLGFVTHVYDAHAYVVRSALLQGLVTGWDPKTKTTDWFFHENVLCRRYCTIPALAWQEKQFESDIDRPKEQGGLF